MTLTTRFPICSRCHHGLPNYFNTQSAARATERNGIRFGFIRCLAYGVPGQYGRDENEVGIGRQKQTSRQRLLVTSLPPDSAVKHMHARQG